MKRTVYFLVFIFAFNICFAESFVMMDGAKYQGEIIKQTVETITLQADNGETYVIERAKISYRTEQKIEEKEEKKISDDELRMAEYQSYKALQSIAKDIHAIQKDTDTIQTVMVWEFGIAIALAVVSIIVAVYGR